MTRLLISRSGEAISVLTLGSGLESVRQCAPYVENTVSSRGNISFDKLLISSWFAKSRKLMESAEIGKVGPVFVKCLLFV